ncbi:MAG: biotin/lipoyl-binding protein [Acidobacteria bacterium]|nr:MAG: biotin/lipoyl-binding protein [Acidobacteriota bacterium]
MSTEIFMPKMSDHMEEGRIVRWLVSEGQRVEAGQIMLEVETDKAIAELESPAAGILIGVRAAEGESVPVGQTIAFVADEGESTDTVHSI